MSEPDIYKLVIFLLQGYLRTPLTFQSSLNIVQKSDHVVDGVMPITMKHYRAKPLALLQT